MRKLLIYAAITISLLASTSFTKASELTTNQCFNTFYPGTRYFKIYIVSDKIVNGRLCYAKWQVYCNGFVSVLAINSFTCKLDTITAGSYCEFYWQQY